MITINKNCDNKYYLNIIENLNNTLCNNFYLLLQNLDMNKLEYFENKIIGNPGAGRNKFEKNLGVMHYYLSLLDCIWCDFYYNDYNNYSGSTKNGAIEFLIQAAQTLIDTASKLKINNIKLQVIDC